MKVYSNFMMLNHSDSIYMYLKYHDIFQTFNFRFVSVSDIYEPTDDGSSSKVMSFIVYQ